MFYGITKAGKLRKTKLDKGMRPLIYSAEVLPKEDVSGAIERVTAYDAYLEKLRMTWSAGLILKGTGTVKKGGTGYAVLVTAEKVDLFYIGADGGMNGLTAEEGGINSALNILAEAGNLIMVSKDALFSYSKEKTGTIKSAKVNSVIKKELPGRKVLAEVVRSEVKQLNLKGKPGTAGSLVSTPKSHIHVQGTSAGNLKDKVAAEQRRIDNEKPVIRSRTLGKRTALNKHIDNRTGVPSLDRKKGAV